VPKNGMAMPVITLVISFIIKPSVSFLNVVTILYIRGGGL